MAGIVKHLTSTPWRRDALGDQLMEISPTESELIVEIRISPADIGQLELGLPVDIGPLMPLIRLSMGSWKGELIYLSSDTLSEKDAQGRTETYYEAEYALTKKLRPRILSWRLTLRPGMTAGVDVRTGKRTVLYFIAKPILRDFPGR